MRNFPRRAQTWRYLGIVAATFVFLTLFVAGSMFLLWHRGPTQLASGDTQFINCVNVVQKTAREHSDTPAIVLVGGSGTLYSVSADELSRQTGQPVVNLGLHAGLRLDYLLYRAGSLLRPGDIAVLFLEPPVIALNDMSWERADWVVPYDLSYLVTLAPTTLPALFSKLTPEEYATRVFAAFFGRTDPTENCFFGMSASGDLVRNLDRNRTDFTRASLAKHLKDPVTFSCPQENLDKLHRFIQQCRNRGIHLIGGYPALAEHPYYSTPEGISGLRDWAAMWDALGVPSLGMPQDFIFSPTLFFDTQFHMHSGGRRLMTAKIAQALCKKDIITCPQKRTSPVMLLSLTHPYPYPAGFISMEGISGPESWGAWSDGPKVELEFAGSLDKPFTLKLNIVGVFSENLKGPLRIRAGGDEKELRVSQPGEYSVVMTPKEPATTLTVDIPATVSPKELGMSSDTRKLGIGLFSIGIAPILNLTTTGFSR